MLAPGVYGRGEETALLPFKGLLWSIVLPNRGCPLAACHIDHLLKKVPFRIEIFSWGDLTYVGVIDIGGSNQIEVNSETALSRPRFQRDLADVFNEEVPYDG